MPRKRALIVDDSNTAQYRLKKMLQGYDLEIDTVDSGESALLYLAKHVPDVVFMDHLMPGMDGFRALQIIKSHPETAMIPVIMYTSKSGDVYTGQARALGALDVISKDAINTADLSKVLRSIHIDPKEKRDSPESPAPASAAADNALPSPPPAELIQLDSEKAARQLVADNARRIELRIVQLEHAIDDSRRVIAAQLIREMQKLRHNLKQEFGGVFKRHEEKQDILLHAINNSSKPLPPKSSPLPFIITLILLLGVLGGLFNQQNALQEVRDQQATQNEQLNLATNFLLDIQADILSQQRQSIVQFQPNAANKTIAADSLEHFVWAFNQSGYLPYSAELIEPNAVVRLNEFLNRLEQMGFKGTLEIALNAGNFCVTVDSYGRALLPAVDTRLGDCILFSELYRFDVMMAQIVNDMHMTLARTTAVSSGDISVIVRRTAEPNFPYPTRQAQLMASEWNEAALQNNRLQVSLRAQQPQ